MAQPILALDLGDRRLGVALNPLGRVILELATVRLGSSAALIHIVESLIDEHGAKTLVLGQSHAGSQAPRQLRDQLLLSRPELGVIIVDETLTTKEAERQLQDESGQGDTDARAARLILEQYLAEWDGADAA